jgi:hypothetical protein
VLSARHARKLTKNVPHFVVHSTLYSPDVESSWLHYATYLLLSQTTRSPDFERYPRPPLIRDRNSHRTDAHLFAHLQYPL